MNSELWSALRISLANVAMPLNSHQQVMQIVSSIESEANKNLLEIKNR